MQNHLINAIDEQLAVCRMELMQLEFGLERGEWEGFKVELDPPAIRKELESIETTLQSFEDRASNLRSMSDGGKWRTLLEDNRLLKKAVDKLKEHTLESFKEVSGQAQVVVGEWRDVIAKIDYCILRIDGIRRKHELWNKPIPNFRRS